MINPIRFAWRTVTKSLVYFFFALGSLVLVTAVFPPIMLFVHPEKRSSRAMRFATHLTFRLMNRVMWLFGLTRVDISREDRRKLWRLRSSIVVANHPSLIDITILMGLIPHPDCIVNARLFERPIVRHVVRRLFIPNSLDFNELLAGSERSLRDGNCLVIFPEGSRTKPGVSPVLKRGSARISLATGFPIVPVRIEANDMRGLRKGDPLWRINAKGRYRFKLSVLDPLYPANYADCELPVAARKMVSDIQERLFSAR